MRLRISASLLLSAFLLPAVGCSSDTSSTAAKAAVRTGATATDAEKKPGGKAPKKPKELSKLTGPTDLVE
jgi:hypothetical protein